MTLYLRIGQAAASITPGRALGTILVAPFYVVGWLLARVGRIVWRMLTWAWAATLIGLHDGWGK